MNPWTEYKADFLAPVRAKAILDWINTQALKPETGRCGEAPTHDSIQWGPRQAYIACVAPGVRIQSSGPIPVRLSNLHAEIEQRYQAHFNSIQVNRHWNKNSEVHAHSDLMHGHTGLYRIYAEAVLRQTLQAGRIFLGIYGHRYSPPPRQEASDCRVARIYHRH